MNASKDTGGGYDPLPRKADVMLPQLAFRYDPSDRSPDVTWIAEQFAGNQPQVVYMNGIRFIPEHTCRDVSDSPYTFVCSECGCKADALDDDFESTVQVNGIASTFHCCPNCCAKVVYPNV